MKGGAGVEEQVGGWELALRDLISLLYTDSTGNYSPPEPPRRKDAGPIGSSKAPVA
jgi:hypothetical protein